MSRVRTRGTASEIAVRKELSKRGVRFRLNVPSLAGKPDVFVPRIQLAIFVNGCFWHGHGCKRATLPKTNHEFWASKIAANAARDRKQKKQLSNLGIRSLVIWTCRKSRLTALCEKIAREYHETPQRHGH
jgi:DNA mismatch endonuclease (patch repair protein)